MPFRINFRNKMGSKFVDESLKSHNEHRKKHGVPALKHNKDITAIAQKWADHLAKTGTFKHSANRDYKTEKMGENIAMKWTSSNEDFTGAQATDQWYEEIKKYNFRTNSGAGTGHFTQVVWKASKEFGIGKAQGKDGKWIVVGNYFPAGNLIGHNAENVFPVGGSKGSTATTSGDSKPSGFASFFGKKSEPEEKIKDQDVKIYGGTSTQTSRKVITETRNGKTYTKTIITETTTGPDGKKSTTTRETVTEEGADNGASGGYDRDFDRRFKELSFGNDRSSDWHHSGPTYNRTTTVSSPKDDKKEKEKKPQKMKDFIDEVVKCHNKYRKKHGKVGDLKKNKDLGVLAQRWADHLAATSVLKHSEDTYKGDKLGENVASRWSSAGADYTGQEVTDQWYSEEAKFDFNNNDFTPGTGHFTQVVWKDSKEIGVGKTVTKDGRVFVVCNYFPAGNYLGHFKENVFPLKD